MTALLRAHLESCGRIDRHTGQSLEYCPRIGAVEARVQVLEVLTGVAHTKRRQVIFNMRFFGPELAHCAAALRQVGQDLRYAVLWD